MADQTLIAAEWLLLNRSHLDAKFIEFQWASEWGLPLYDFEVSLLSGRHIGRGTGKNEQIALAKAVSEAIERMVCSELGIATHGVAAHPCELVAKSNAVCEALERALFRSHLQHQTPFIKQSPTQEINSIIQSVEKADGVVSLMQMRSMRSYESCVFIIEKNGRKFLGLSLDKGVETVQRKAAIEAIRNFAVFCKNPQNFTDQVEKNSDLWNCNPEFFKNNSSIFNLNHVSESTFTGITNKIEKLQIDSKLSLPVSVYRAEVILEVTL